MQNHNYDTELIYYKIQLFYDIIRVKNIENSEKYLKHIKESIEEPGIESEWSDILSALIFYLEPTISAKKMEAELPSKTIVESHVKKVSKI